MYLIIIHRKAGGRLINDNCVAASLICVCVCVAPSCGHCVYKVLK